MIYIGDKRVKFYIGNKKVNHVYLGLNKIYSSGNLVKYHLDNSESFKEEVGEGQTCLSPTSFVPYKDGYNFVGWREDNVASGEVLTEKLMGSEPITLYAVFKKSITATYYNGSTSATKTVKDLYYNNGNITNPTFNLSQATKSGWSQRGWSTSTAGNASVVYNNNANFQISADVTLYGLYSQTVKLSYHGNGSTGGNTSDQTGTRYYNSSGNYTNPSFTLKSNSFSRTYYRFVNWAMGSTGGTRYNPGASVTLSNNTVFYAMWTAATSQKSVSIPVVTAINNWQYVNTLAEFGCTFVNTPSVSISGDGEQRVASVRKTYAIVNSTHQQGGGTWNVKVNASGTAYNSSGASGIGVAKGQFTATINNWQGGSRTVQFGKTFKSPPTVDIYAPVPSSEALPPSGWNVKISNITTTGCTISWGGQSGGSQNIGWIAEGAV